MATGTAHTHTIHAGGGGNSLRHTERVDGGSPWGGSGAGVVGRVAPEWALATLSWTQSAAKSLQCYQGGRCSPSRACLFRTPLAPNFESLPGDPTR